MIEMKTYSIIFLVGILLLASLATHAQAERKHIRQGNKSYEKGNFNEAEVSFKKAADLQPDIYQIRKNMGAASYKQEKYEDASKSFAGYMLAARSVDEQAVAWYNLGTSLLQAGDYVKSIDALQKSLILNPANNQARHNLSVAKYMLAKQQNEGGGQCSRPDGDEQQQQQQQGNNNEQQQEQQDGQSQPNPEEISKEDAQRILDALEQEEKDVQDKLQKQKARVQKIQVEKEW